MLRIYVGNLPYTTQDEDLNEAFSAFGEVESTIVIRDRETGRSRCFGFVEMSDDSSATAAIESLNGKNFQGRNLTVNEAKPRENRF